MLTVDSKRARKIIAALAIAILWSPALAGAQETDDIDDQVAGVLYERGRFLFASGDVRNAKKLLIESLERSGDGPSSRDALAMLRSCNERLGLANLEDGRPKPRSDGPMDPYGGGGSGAQGPLDPYGAAPGNDQVLDPYGPASGSTQPPPGAALPQSVDTIGDDGDGDEGARRGLIAWSGFYGLTLGLAIGGPEGDDNNVTGGAVLGGLALATGGVLASNWLTNKYPLTSGEYAALGSAGTWAAVSGGFLGDVFTGDDSSSNAIYRSVAIGGLVGIGLGTLYVTRADPTEGQVAMTNSLGLYGMTGGLLLGVAIDPPRSEAYSLNAAIGSLAGLAAGVYLSGHIETTRRHTLLADVGALAGAVVPWALIYPLVSDDSTSGDEQALGAVSAITMLAGAYLTWRFTGGQNAGAADGDSPDGAEAAVAPALVQRSSSGRWRLSAPLPRPVRAATSGLAESDAGLGVDLFAGRF